MGAIGRMVSRKRTFPRDRWYGHRCAEGCRHRRSGDARRAARHPPRDPDVGVLHVPGVRPRWDVGCVLCRAARNARAFPAASRYSHPRGRLPPAHPGFGRRARTATAPLLLGHPSRRPAPRFRPEEVPLRSLLALLPAAACVAGMFLCIRMMRHSDMPAATDDLDALRKEVADLREELARAPSVPPGSVGYSRREVVRRGSVEPVSGSRPSSPPGAAFATGEIGHREG